MSPLGVEILLHYGTTSGSDFYPWSSAADSLAQQFVKAGLLVDNGPQTIDPMSKGIEPPRYVGAGRPLNMYVEAVCAVPLPVQKWEMPKP